MSKTVAKRRKKLDKTKHTFLSAEIGKHAVWTQSPWKSAPLSNRKSKSWPKSKLSSRKNGLSSVKYSRQHGAKEKSTEYKITSSNFLRRRKPRRSRLRSGKWSARAKNLYRGCKMRGACCRRKAWGVREGAILKRTPDWRDQSSRSDSGTHPWGCRMSKTSDPETMRKWRFPSMQSLRRNLATTARSVTEPSRTYHIRNGCATKGLMFTFVILLATVVSKLGSMRKQR